MNGTTAGSMGMASAVGFLATGALVWACSSSGGDGSRLEATGSGAQSGSGNGAGGLQLSSGTSSSQGGAGGSCEGLSVQAQPGDAHFFIVVDKSGSMGSNNKWTNTLNAFTQFFQDPSADPLHVALRFWPDNGCGEPSGSCGSAALQACATPEVPMGQLTSTAHEAALVSAFNNQSPGGLTPMSVALDGAIQYASQQQSMGEATDVFGVILLTDGMPTDCDTNINNIANIAANGLSSSGVLTFAIGIQGSSEPQMNQIAAAGGTQMGYFIGSSSTQDIIDALKAIASSVVQCVFAMPADPSPDMPIDPNQVNVTYTPGNGMPQDIPQVPSQADCGTSGGWYYDDNTNPTAIYLCPTTCATVQSDSMANIAIRIGCATIVG